MPGRSIRAMHDVCEGIVVVDTFVALSDRVSVELDGAWYHGHVYGEHDADDSREAKARRLWASLDNESSFWFTEPSLLNLFARAGYTSSFEALAPTMPGNLRDRKTYVAVKGRPARVLTSDETDRQPGVDVPEGANPRMDPSQVSHGVVFTTAKRVLPQGMKDAIKPILRAVHLLPPDQTPEFQRESAKSKAESRAPRPLGVQAALLARDQDPLAGDRERRGAQADLVAVGGVPDLLQRVDHDLVEADVDLVLAPEEAREVLHPLEVADGHAAGVADDVGHDQDAALAEDVVGLGQRRAVGAFEDQLGLDPPRALGRDLAFERGRDEDVAVDVPERLVVDPLAALDVGDAGVVADRAPSSSPCRSRSG